ncbi:MAG: TonB-dependent receptor, partial [Candidatus Zixiibacteriota bacterium]
GNITFVVDHFERDQLFNRDRDFTSVGLSVFGFPGSFYAFDPNNGTFIGTFADARCPQNLGDSQEFPNSLLRFGGVICGFNYAATSAHSAQIRRDTVFINANYQITDDIRFKTRATVSRVDGFGRYAPAPAAGGIPGGGGGGLFPTMGANNPNNPTQDPNLFPGGPYDLWIFYRNVPGGPRDSHTTDTLTDLLVGIEGYHEFAGGGDWQLNVNHARNKNVDLGTGYGFGSLLQQAIDDGTFDLFNVNGNYDPAVAQTFGHETVFEAQVINFSVDGQVSFDELFTMDGGAVPLVVGFEYNDLDFYQVNDPQSNSGNVFGTSGGDNIFAARFRKSVYAEMVLPVFEGFEADIAVRYDQYSDFGNTVNPKVSFSYRPTDDLLLRASYGEGFRAPNMDDLYGNRSQSFNSAFDHWGCDNGVPNTCQTTQYQNFIGGNPDLDAETSKGYTAGVVYAPTQDLSFSLSYYNIELDGGIAQPSLQGILDNDNRIRRAGGAGDPRVHRNNNGGISFVDRFAANLATFETDGIDFEARYKLDAGNLGAFDFLFETSWVLSFDSIDENGAAADVGVGEFFADGTAQPEYRSSMLVQWSMGDIGAAMQVNYVPAMDHVNTSTGQIDDTLDSWTTVNLQFTYSTPWNGKVIVGARNIANEDPPVNTTTLDSPFYASSIHDIWGRVPYLRYEQSF